MPRAHRALAAYLRCNGGMTTTATSAPTVTVGTGPVSFDDVVAVARQDAPVVISPESLAEVRRTRVVIEALADDTVPHYGVSTGFGALATRHIPVELRAQLQRSLVRSHAAGSGAEVEREVVRALMLLRISTLATGRTGIREETLQTYLDRYVIEYLFGKGVRPLAAVRRRDRTVITVVEKDGSAYFVRVILRLEQMRFPEQQERLEQVLSLSNVRQ